MQMAFECVWMVSRICGNDLGVMKKKKCAWSAVYWENEVEKDVVRYALVVVRVRQHGRREVRDIQMQNYDETRRNAPRASTVMVRTQAIHNGAKVGWRLHEELRGSGMRG